MNQGVEEAGVDKFLTFKRNRAYFTGIYLISLTAEGNSLSCLMTTARIKFMVLACEHSTFDNRATQPRLSCVQKKGTERDGNMGPETQNDHNGDEGEETKRNGRGGRVGTGTE